MSNFGYFERIASILKSKLTQLVQKGIAYRIDDSSPMQTLQVGFSKSDIQDNVYRIQNFGFTSVPPKGADTYVLFPSGERSTALAFGVESFSDRLSNLNEGEAAIYSLGNEKAAKVIVKPSGHIELSNGSDTLANILESALNKFATFKIIVPPSTETQIVESNINLADEISRLRKLLK